MYAGKCNYKSCPQGTFGNNSTQTCDNSCSSLNQEFLDKADNICKLCDSTCKTCATQSSNACTSCHPNANLTSGYCRCNDQYYLIIKTPCINYPCSSCSACYLGCKKCNGSGIADCQTCIAGN